MKYGICRTWSRERRISALAALSCPSVPCTSSRSVVLQRPDCGGGFRKWKASSSVEGFVVPWSTNGLSYNSASCGGVARRDRMERSYVESRVNECNGNRCSGRNNSSPESASSGFIRGLRRAVDIFGLVCARARTAVALYEPCMLETDHRRYLMCL